MQESKPAEGSPSEASAAHPPGVPDTVEPEGIDKTSELLRPHLKEPDLAPKIAHQIVVEARSHSGPLPSPELLAEYDRILPGAAREIMDMAVREQTHRHASETAERRYPYWGMFLGFFALVFCLTEAVYLALHGERWISALLIGAPLMTTIGWS